MKVIDIESIDSKKVKVILENGLVLPFYKGELNKYQIRQNEDIDEKTLTFFTDELLYKRAKERAFYILKNADKTEKQVRDKLKLGYYPCEVTDRVIDTLKSYGYIDDEAFARSYIKLYSETKSIRAIKEKLYQKGVSAGSIDIAVEEYLEENSYNPKELIKNILNKGMNDYSNMDLKQKNKLISRLMRKGFLYEDIKESLKIFDKNA